MYCVRCWVVPGANWITTWLGTACYGAWITTGAPCCGGISVADGFSVVGEGGSSVESGVSVAVLVRGITVGVSEAACVGSGNGRAPVGEGKSVAVGMTVSVGASVAGATVG
jgi:hypothetical protein